jgi:glycerophosphoryl diester phosphodiesterase
VRRASLEHPVPTLEAVLELIRPIDVTLVLELKHPHLYPGIEEQTLNLIDQYALGRRVILVSFDLISLERVSRINSEIETGQLYIHGFYMPKVKNTSLLEVFWLVPFIDPTFVWRQHRKARRVWIWTVDTQFLMKFLLWLGIDGITTNCPWKWPKKIC